MAELPSGTVTFLFTDIEGSTGLVGRLGDGYGDVMASTGGCFARRSRRAAGHEIDSRGDEFFAFFARTRDAIAAALAAQRQFAGHEWPAGGAVRVRDGHPHRRAGAGRGRLRGPRRPPGRADLPAGTAARC